MSVTILDAQPGSGASWAAAGMLAPVTEVHYGEDRLLELNLASSLRYPAFVRELEGTTGIDTGYHPSGTLVVARDADDNAVLQDLYEFQVELGLDVSRLRGRECIELEPGLAPSTRGGIMVEGDHQIDNRALVAALIAACEAGGVRFERHNAVAVQNSGGRVSGVATAHEEVEADSVVVAAGCWSGSIEGVAPVLPVRPVKGQLLHLRSADRMPPARRNIRGLDVYLVPRPDGRVVAGATVEERAFDKTVTAGAVLDLLRATYELLPGVTELELDEIAVGLRPGSPDNAPMIGETALAGLVAATGHFRNGVLLTPVTADCIADLVEKGTVAKEIEAFSPRRFDAGG